MKRRLLALAFLVGGMIPGTQAIAPAAHACGEFNDTPAENLSGGVPSYTDLNCDGDSEQTALDNLWGSTCATQEVVLGYGNCLRAPRQ